MTKIIFLLCAIAVVNAHPAPDAVSEFSTSTYPKLRKIIDELKNIDDYLFSALLNEQDLHPTIKEYVDANRDLVTYNMKWVKQQNSAAMLVVHDKKCVKILATYAKEEKSALDEYSACLSERMSKHIQHAKNLYEEISPFHKNVKLTNDHVKLCLNPNESTKTNDCLGKLKIIIDELYKQHIKEINAVINHKLDEASNNFFKEIQSCQFKSTGNPFSKNEEIRKCYMSM